MLNPSTAVAESYNFTVRCGCSQLVEICPYSSTLTQRLPSLSPPWSIPRSPVCPHRTATTGEQHTVGAILNDAVFKGPWQPLHVKGQSGAGGPGKRGRKESS